MNEWEQVNNGRQRRVTAGLPADDGPDVWDKSQETKPEVVLKPVSLELVQKILAEQEIKWLRRKKGTSYDDEKMSARTAFQLLSDQARMIKELLERIP